jgi:hypothetical protein
MVLCFYYIYIHIFMFYVEEFKVRSATGITSTLYVVDVRLLYVVPI